jgi:hypothetical protein
LTLSLHHEFAVTDLAAGNPGSLLWLVEDRPVPDETCDGVDEYKYGLAGSFPGYCLGDVNDIGRDGVVDRYLTRNIHYGFGLVRFRLWVPVNGRIKLSTRLILETETRGVRRW